MESPAYSSNPLDYINSHQTEYDEIIALNEIALEYMFSLFDKDDQTGMRGWIMAYACWNILGGESVLGPMFKDTDLGTGQEWYDSYKLLAVRN